MVLPSLDPRTVEEVFRRLLLVRLHGARRLSAGFMQRLLSWSPSGFSVFAEQLVAAHDTQRLERLARYMTRAPQRLDAIERHGQRQVHLKTPPEPSTGATVKRLDVLDWIHSVTQQLPDPWFHCVRYFGAYACRNRIAPRPTTATPQARAKADNDVDEDTTRRASWARLMNRLFEIDPLLCSCGGLFRVISIITRRDVIERMLAHVAEHTPTEDSLENESGARAPPELGSRSSPKTV